MGVFGRVKSWFGFGGKAESVAKDIGAEQYQNGFQFTPVVYTNWGGEKNFGELGTAASYYMDYQILAVRSWQAYVESDTAQLIINEMVNWSIGTGLRLESEPKTDILRSEGVNLSDAAARDFSSYMESSFSLHFNSKYSTYSKTVSGHQLGKEVSKHALLSGDCLVIIRESSVYGTNIEMVDGCRVVTPMTGSYTSQAKGRGNEIQYGVELNKRGGHVAYYVQNKNNALDIKRIPARGVKTGRLQAFLVYGSKYRIGYHRGMPILSGILETLKKLDRYKEAMVGSAEERAKIVYQIVHQQFSDGENPLIEKMRNSMSINGVGINEDQTSAYNVFDETAQKIATSSEKETYNMPVGAELKALESKQELYFKDFMDVNLDMIFAAMGIPPEVAKKTYNSNYSASRMAIKSWEFSLNVKRNEFAAQFYKPIYHQFLTSAILNGKVKAPGYLNALLIDKNHFVLEAYRNSKWIGSTVPAVDPVKEVQAERAKLGPLGANVPLTTPEKAVEHLGQGDYMENTKKFDEQISGYEIAQKGENQLPAKK